MAFDHVVIFGPGSVELLARLRCGAAFLANQFRACDLRRLPEATGDTDWIHLVDEVTNGWVRADAGRGIGFTAFNRDPELTDIALLALNFGSVLEHFLRDAAGVGDGFDLAIALQREAFNPLSGLGDAVDNTSGPAGLNADDNNARDIRVGPSADQGPEMQIQILAELQTSVVMRQRQCPFNVMLNLFTGRVGQIIQGQDDDVVADADAAVLAAVSHEIFGQHGSYHFFVLRLWV